MPPLITIGVRSCLVRRALCLVSGADLAYDGDGDAVDDGKPLPVISNLLSEHSLIDSHRNIAVDRRGDPKPPADMVGEIFSRS